MLSFKVMTIFAAATVLIGCANHKKLLIFGNKVYGGYEGNDDIKIVELDIKDIMKDTVSIVRGENIGWNEKQIAYKYGEPSEVLFTTGANGTMLKCIRFRYANGGKIAFILSRLRDEWVVTDSLSNPLGLRMCTRIMPEPTLDTEGHTTAESYLFF